MSRRYPVVDVPLVKVTHVDLKRMGVVRSRFDQHEKIKAGKLRPPHKDGDSMQAAAWWWWDEVREDLEREREDLERERNNSAEAGN